MDPQERAKMAAVNAYANDIESELDGVYLDEDADLGVSLTDEQLKKLKLSHVGKLRGKK